MKADAFFADDSHWLWIGKAQTIVL